MNMLDLITELEAAEAHFIEYTSDDKGGYVVEVFSMHMLPASVQVQLRDADYGANNIAYPSHSGKYWVFDHIVAV